MIISGMTLFASFASAHQSTSHTIPSALTIGQIGQSDIQDQVGAILIQAYKNIGIKLTITSLPSKRSLSYSNNGAIDGELLRVKGTERKYQNLIRIPVSLYQLQGTAYTLHGQSHFEDPTQLLRFPTAIHNGVMWEEKFVKPFSHNVLRVKGTIKKFKLLKLGRVDYVLSSRKRAQQVIAEHFKHDKFIEVTPTLTDINLFHYLHKKHHHLIPLIEAELNRMSKHTSLPIAH